MTEKKEIWKPIPIEEIEDFCEVSNLGRFRSLDRITTTRSGFFRKIEGKLLKSSYYSNGYLQFSFKHDSKRYTAIAHRLVAKAFIDNPLNLPQVNHKNGIKDDNRVGNLEWMTRSENMKHSFKELKREVRDMSGTLNTNAKLNEEDVLSIRELYKKGDITQKELSIMFKVKVPAIWKIVNNKNWKHLIK